MIAAIYARKSNDQNRADEELARLCSEMGHVSRVERYRVGDNLSFANTMSGPAWWTSVVVWWTARDAGDRVRDRGCQRRLAVGGARWHAISGATAGGPKNRER
jgi:glutathione S-transferase